MLGMLLQIQVMSCRQLSLVLISVGDQWFFLKRLL